MAIRIDLCENDDYGTPTGKAWKIEFYPLDLELEESLWPPRGVSVSRIDDKHIRIGREVYEVFQWHSCTGNLYWNSVWMSGLDATRLINYLMQLKYWRCTNGEDWMFEAFNNKQKIFATNKETHDRFKRAFEKASPERDEMLGRDPVLP